MTISAYFAFSFVLLAAVIARPTGAFMLVVTDPKLSAEGNMAVIAKAGGRFVWAGRAPWISVAQSDEPGFAERLFDAGAYLVLNHDLAVGCREGK
ncbi:hypothetical protein [Rhizobium glycinendophyticum]|uniref:Uncharacterized protein n=1 Tax=Rhizobium glycinendophyticum TaxID=2589807 RepID=A0A504U7Z8_9HYPH|nr:hypothetical protein [Rhizobium glycinendophyticum]TPP10599.1 hypothetical protein FJQ55_07065 [Rhizobium glycinendophyticum]